MSSTKSRSRIALAATAAIAAALFLATPPAVAQTLTGVIIGEVTDAEGQGLPGATVTISSPQLIRGTAEAVTDRNGSFRFPALPPGTYSVTFELQGFQVLEREGVAVRAGATVAANAELRLAGVEETVTVTGAAPLVDVRGSQVMETYSQELIENIPSSRVFVDIYHMMPGVEDGMYRELTPGASTVYGGTNRDNRINIEGANLNDAQVANVASDISYEVVQEVQAVTGGISAEFGGATASVVNIITKSGGNEFSGTGYGYYTGESLQGENLTDELRDRGFERAGQTVKDLNYGVSVGGPVLRNRLWFFGNYDHKEQEETLIGFPLPVEGPQNMFLAKFTGQVADRHNLTGMYQYRAREDFPFIPQPRNQGLASQRSQDHVNHITYIGYTGILSDSTYLDAKLNFSNQRRFQDFPFADDCTEGQFPEPCAAYQDRATGNTFGGWYRDVVHPGWRNTRQVKGDLSHFRSDWLGGSHDLKFGAVYDLLYVDELREWQNGARLHFLLDGAPNRIRLSNNPFPLRGNVGTTGIYAQDQWTQGRVTLNLGLRFERHDAWIPEGFSGGVNFERRTFPEKDIIAINTLSPRVGVNVDLFGDGRTALKANYGRYYSQLYAGQFSSLAEFGGGSLTFEWDDLNNDLLWQPGEEGRLLSDTTARELAAVDPNLRVPYWQTVTVGVDHAVRPDIRVGTAVIWRKETDTIETIDLARPFDEAYIPITLTNPHTGDPITVYALNPAFAGIPRAAFITNPDSSLCSFCPDPERNYKGVQFVVERRMRENWQLYGSYVLSAAEGNKGTHHRTSTSSLFGDPNNFVNAFGKTTLDRTHSVKVQGTYRAPAEVWLSFAYVGQTGVPFQQDRGVMGPVVRLTSPEMVIENFIDVLALPPGEERFDARHLVDFRLEKRFDLSGKAFLGLMVDIRNLLNSSYTNWVERVRIGDARFDQPASIVLPRTLRLGARLEF